jgi:hypothetical protein
MAKRGIKKKSGTNAVSRAVAALGGPTKTAGICGVSNAAIHKWINRGSVTLLKNAVKLSKASGIPIEEFLGEGDEE